MPEPYVISDYAYNSIAYLAAAVIVLGAAYITIKRLVQKSASKHNFLDTPFERAEEGEIVKEVQSSQAVTSKR